MSSLRGGASSRRFPSPPGVASSASLSRMSSPRRSVSSMSLRSPSPPISPPPSPPSSPSSVSAEGLFASFANGLAREEDSLLCLAALKTKYAWGKKRLRTVAKAATFFTRSSMKVTPEAVEQWLNEHVEGVKKKLFCSRCREHIRSTRSPCLNRFCDLYK